MHHIDTNIISFAAHNAIVDIHYHKCFQMVIAMHEPFNCIIGQKNFYNLKGFLINQNITHSCRAEDTSVLVFFIDAESYLGWQLKEILGKKHFINIEEILTEPELKKVTLQYGQHPAIKELRKIANELLEKMFSSRQLLNRSIDIRILKVIEYIDSHLDDPLALENISKQIFLSTERTRHLFVEQTGIPFSQYVLWKRIKLVLTQVIKDKTPMANSVIQNGFTDQAHFSRLFKRTFGITAKHMLKDSRFIQFLMPEL